MLYANYIRNKMHHLVKSVFASGYPLKIISKFKKKAVGYTIHGKTEIGKNLISYPYIDTTKTTNGVTYTDNGDGSVTVSGTATGYSDFFFKIMSIAPNTTFTFSKNQSDDAANVAFTLRQLDENRALIGTEISLIPTVATHTFTTAENTRYIQIACKRYANAECKGTYKPMLELGDTATEYEPYTVYGVGDKTKNLIPYLYATTTKTENGVTFTDNGDGSITANGTATGASQYFLRFSSDYFKLDKNATYILSGCPSGGTLTTYRMEFFMSQGNTQLLYKRDTGNGVIINNIPENYDIITIKIMVYSGTTVNNLVFKPMLELGNTATDYEPYGYKIPLVNTGKNLIPYPYSGFGGEKTKIINGITFTDNGGGLITLNGTATADVEFNFTGDFALPPGNFQISINHDYQDFYLGLDEREGNPDKNGNYIVYCDLIVSKGVTINNGTCRPQIELGNTATDYEPYRAPDTTNVYHTAPLKDGESISYKADGLPELQLYKGENNITADTAVAPSAIDIRYLN